jgi:hypothetical protein
MSFLISESAVHLTERVMGEKRAARRIINQDVLTGGSICFVDIKSV